MPGLVEKSPLKGTPSVGFTRLFSGSPGIYARVGAGYPSPVPARDLPIVPAATARRLLLGAQGLLDDPRRKATPEGLYDLIERMGFVQIDSINMVERAHHLILAARLQGYRPALLERLRLILIVGTLGAIGLGTLLGVTVTRTALRPLAQVTSTSERIAARTAAAAVKNGHSASWSIGAVNSMLARAWLYKASLSRRPALIEQATIYANRGAKLSSSDPESHITLGRLLNASGKSTAAIASFPRALPWHAGCQQSRHGKIHKTEPPRKYGRDRRCAPAGAWFVHSS